MRGLYYAFIYPYLSYVNIVWESRKYTTRLAPIRRLQKTTYWSSLQGTIDFTFTWYKQWSHIALFMFRYYNNNLPSSFSDLFSLNKDIHQYNTSSSFLSRGQRSLFFHRSCWYPFGRLSYHALTAILCTLLVRLVL